MRHAALGLEVVNAEGLHSTRQAQAAITVWFRRLKPSGPIRSNQALGQRIPLDLIAEHALAHHGLLASKLEKKASTKLGAIQTASFVDANHALKEISRVSAKSPPPRRTEKTGR